MTPEQPDSPPAGWYQNPENLDGPLRWWTGSEWSDILQTPTPPPPPGIHRSGPYPGGLDVPSRYGSGAGFGSGTIAPAGLAPLPSPSQAVQSGLGYLARSWRPVLLISLVCYALPGAIAAAFVPRFLYYLIDVAELAEAQADVVPLGGLGWSMLAATLLTLLWMLGTLAAATLALRASDGAAMVANESDHVGFNGAWPALGLGLKRLPVFAAWAFLIGLGLTIATVLTSLLIGIVPPLLIFLVPGYLALSGFVIVKCAFVPFQVVESAPNPVEGSASVSKGRFWEITARLVVVALSVLVVIWLMNVFGQALIGATATETLSMTLNGQTDQVVIPNAYVLSAVAFVTSLVAGLLWWGAAASAAASLYRAAPSQGLVGSDNLPR